MKEKNNTYNKTKKAVKIRAPSTNMVLESAESFLASDNTSSNAHISHITSDAECNSNESKISVSISESPSPSGSPEQEEPEEEEIENKILNLFSKKMTISH